jgi:TonB-linked SusC/RagA family outer membrane protein
LICNNEYFWDTNLLIVKIINLMRNIYTLMVMLFLTVSGYSQMTITGKVIEEGTNEPLPGVSIVVLGSTNGVSTDFDGNYTIENVEQNSVLSFSFMGFTTQEVTVTSQTELNIVMTADSQVLGEVVVTALNIKRDKASLGYSVSQLDSQELSVAKEANVMNSLSGKVSGLQITKSSTGVGGSTRVLLRGVTTISGSNRPLVVIDGIPVSNNANGGGQWGGYDEGDDLSDINPEDIESMSVLKGAGASAAYGSLGMNGVILITTKSGKKQKGYGVSINSSINVTQIALTPDLQNEYGTGAFGRHPGINDLTGRPYLVYPWSWSWGPKMDGHEYTNWLGKKDTFTPQGNPYKDFYQSGYSMVNSIAVQGNNENGSARLSITDQRSEGILPGNTLSKQTFNLRASTTLAEKLHIDGKATYVKNVVSNSPHLAESASNTSLQLSLMPRDIKMYDLMNNYEDEDGNEIKYNSDPYFSNPVWTLHHVRNTIDKDRFQGMFSAKLDINDDFYITAKSGLDYTSNHEYNSRDRGSVAVRDGRGDYENGIYNNTNWNSDLMATYTADFEKLNIVTSVGGNMRSYYSEFISNIGYGSKVDNLHNIENHIETWNYDGTDEEQTYSFIGLSQLSYNDYLYFDVTVRNDHTSALPQHNDSYWYHSENASLLFTELFDITSDIFNRGKIRGSYAMVGNGTGYTPHYYNIIQASTLPYALAEIPDVLPSLDLKPESTYSWELGAELSFFSSRVNVDFTYYNARSVDQIMEIPVSVTTGYSYKLINAGSIRNTGIELQVNTTPYLSENFTWDLGLTFTKSNSVVESLNEGLSSITLNALRSVTVEARTGEEFGTLYGYDYKRDKLGRKLITDSGETQRGEIVKLGTMNPDFYGGITNNLSYRSFQLRTLISFQKGGNIYSYGRAYRKMFGTDIRTLEGRENGIIEDGINENTGNPNTVAIPAMSKYYNDVNNNEIAVNDVLDASNVKLRELSLTYTLPSEKLENAFIRGLSFSITGRDLFFIYNAAEDIDPESGYSGGTTGVALEHSSMPSTRSFGADLRLNF